MINALKYSCCKLIKYFGCPRRNTKWNNREKVEIQKKMATFHNVFVSASIKYTTGILCRF